MQALVKRVLLGLLGLVLLLAAVVAVNTLRQSPQHAPVADTAESVLEHVRKVVDDPRVELKIAAGSFAGVADHVYRFSPIRSGPQDLQRFHGTNERLSVANLAEMIRFYHRLVQQAAQ